MFIHYRTRGFILKKEDRGEADRNFTIFTENYGKLELLAKAERKIKSKLRSGLELFYLSDIEFIQGKTQKTITDAILENNFKNLKNNLLRLSISRRIAETFDTLVGKQESDDALWNLLIEVFGKINALGSKTITYRLVYCYFLWNFFRILGYGLDLHSCSLCQKKLSPNNLFFGKKEEGMVCQHCRHLVKSGIDVKDSTVKIIRLFLQKNWQLLEKLKISEEDYKSLKNFSDYYLKEVSSKLS